MTTKPLIVSLSCSLLLASTLLHAAPPEQDDAHNGKHGTSAVASSQPGGKAQHQQPSQGKTQGQSKPQSASKAAAPSQSKAQGGKPPSDFSSVRQVFQDRRAQIGKGGSLPAGVHIQAGKPLPSGYGKRLDSAQLKGVPSYAGYEWRRVGSDMVLVAITTGIVHTILSGVLN